MKVQREKQHLTGARIRKIREQLGLTQEQFAAVLGIHVVTLSRWENDAPHKPTPYQLDIIRLLAKAHDPEQAGIEAGRLLARHGPIPALSFLLRWVLEREEEKKNRS